MNNPIKKCGNCGVEFPPKWSEVAHLAKRRFCSEACSQAGLKGQRRSSFGKAKKTLEQRFWFKVGKDNLQDDACWTWTGAKTKYGYGYLGGTRGEKSRLAHRLSYELSVGPVPDGQCVLHRCDNPPCVNPAHLFLGTRADNNADRVSKGREANHKGENNGRAKLTQELARLVRKMRSGGASQQSIADVVGVAQTTVSRILRGELWKE